MNLHDKRKLMIVLEARPVSQPTFSVNIFLYFVNIDID